MNYAGDLAEPAIFGMTSKPCAGITAGPEQANTSRNRSGVDTTEAMKKLFLGVAAATTLSAGLISTPAQAAPAHPIAVRCHAHQVGKHWTCVTPGSYCPATAHGRYGYAVKTGKLYRCVQYSNGRWRWKRA